MHWHGKFSLDQEVGVQKLHTQPTPRVGGLSIFFALVIATIIWQPEDSSIKTQQFLPILTASLPVFLIGLWNDLFKNVSALWRLIVAALSALLVILSADLKLVTVDFFLIDFFLENPAFSIAFTTLAIAGIVHAFNIIDGLNGLAIGLAVISLAMMAGICYASGDIDLAGLILVLISTLLGILLFNFPLGRLFLGDSGAYLIGFLVGWITVLLVLRNPQVSPWAGLLCCALPVVETLASIYRRLRSGHPVGAPDLHHLHSLIKLNVVSRVKSGWPLHYRNSAAAVLVWLVAITGSSGGLIFYENTFVLILWFSGFCILYGALYLFVRRPAKPKTVRAD